MDKVRRIFWILFYRFLLRIKHVSYGQSMRICDRLYIKTGRNSKFQIGENFAFSSGGGYNPLARNIKGSITIEDNAELLIADNVGISSCCLWVFKSLKIGTGSKIGADSILLDSDAHSLNYLERGNSSTDRPNAQRKGIVIGDNVLIGTRCIILKGVSIGNRSIIGSGSVVVKSIPDDCIAAGNPAKVIRMINQEI